LGCLYHLPMHLFIVSCFLLCFLCSLIVLLLFFFFFFFKRQELCTLRIYKTYIPYNAWKEQRSRNSKKVEQKEQSRANSLTPIQTKFWGRTVSGHTPLKTSIVPFPPNTPHQTNRNALPDCTKSMTPKVTLPESYKIYYPPRHHPMDTKEGKNHIPNFPQKRTVKKQMVYCFPIFLA
jgi:hypothetical protein